MPTDNKVISHEFAITEIAFRGIPSAAHVFNELDYHGSLLGLQRLPGERNAEYKQRLLDVYVRRANSSYTGLVNGITRELGLKFFTPIKITTATGIDPSWSPRIEFIDSLVYIWKDSFTKQLDRIIDRGDPRMASYFIGGLVDAINASNIFVATVLDPKWSYKRSDSIVNQSSSKLVAAQPLLPSLTNYLGVGYIDRGSVVFNNLNVFKHEVASVSEVSSPGRYHINYQTGLITSFSLPADGSTIQYSFRQENFQPIASPVIIRAIHSPEFQRVMFNQNEQFDGTFTSGTPTDKGASIINELLSVVPMYWGP